MAGVVVDPKDIIKLENIGVTDSKLIAKHKRQDMFESVKEIVKDYEIIVVEPTEIDDALNSDSLNLNWLEAHKGAEIINKLKPTKAIVDSPSSNTDNYKSYMANLIKDKKIELVCEHKADLNYIEVGAASILAKVTRDNLIEEIKKKIGINFGSGYPSDSLTQKFLKENWNKYPEIFRKTWASYKKYENAKNQSSLADFETFDEKENNVFDENDKKHMEFLLDYGYNFVSTTSKHEVSRLKGDGTIVLYKTGKVLLQGKIFKKKEIIDILRDKGFIVKD